MAFSGGKDSTVMLHMVLKHVPDCAVRMYDFGIKMPRPYLHESIRIAKELGAKNFQLFERHSNMLQDLFGVHFPEMKKQGYDLVFVGLRKDESLKRRRRMVAKRYLTLKESWPLESCNSDFIWGYIFKNKLPYHSHYDKYSELYDPRIVRFSSYFDAHFSYLGKENEDTFFNWRYAYSNNKEI